MTMTSTLSRSKAFRRTTIAAMSAALALGMVAGAASAQSPAASMAPAGDVALASTTTDLGTFLTGANGLTLYYFTRDAFSGQSICGGKCAEAWPPLLVGEGSAITAADGIDGVTGMIERADGTYQVTYDGRPLYYFAKDAAAGDVAGQGLGGVWFVATTDGSSPANPTGIELAATTTDLGTFLTGKDGLTLYYFTKDTTPGVSVCEGDCATNWPPVTVPPGSWPTAGEGVTGVVGVAARSDGSWGVTYDGRPLYYFAKDAAAGDVNGQGVGDVWYVAQVDGSIPAE